MLKSSVDCLLYDGLGLSQGTNFANAAAFFFYETSKILLLLFFISCLTGIINIYLPINRLKNGLTSHKFLGLQYLCASLLGAVVPLCSCSSVPLFIGFVKGGIPLGISFAFLITSPLVDEVAVLMLAKKIGMGVTFTYIVTGILLGVLGGSLMGRLGLERYLKKDYLNKGISKQRVAGLGSSVIKLPFGSNMVNILNDSYNVVKDVWIYVSVSIAIGAIVYAYVPNGFFEEYFTEGNILIILLMVVIALPIYANAAGVVPLIEVIIKKGVSVGTALSFMMGIIGVSFPEAILLRKLMSRKLILIFFGITAGLFIISGWFFNMVF